MNIPVRIGYFPYPPYMNCMECANPGFSLEILILILKQLDWFLFRPFSPLLWFILLAQIAVIAILIYGISRFSDSFTWCSELCALCRQRSMPKDKLKLPLLMMVLILASIVIRECYAGSILGSILAERNFLPFKDTRELGRKVASRELNLATYYTTDGRVFELIDRIEHSELREFSRAIKVNPPVFVEKYSLINYISQNENTVGMVSAISAPSLLKETPLPCHEYLIVEDYLLPVSGVSYKIMGNRSKELEREFRKVIPWIWSFGNKMQRRYDGKGKTCLTTGLVKRIEDTNSEKPLTLKHLRDVFIIYGSGILTAIICALLGR